MLQISLLKKLQNEILFNILMADIKSPIERSKNMSAIKCKDTKPEIFVRKGLFARGFRYRITPKYIHGHPDIYLAKYNLAIFIHGCFWHRHTGCKLTYTPKSNIEFWGKKFTRNQNRDKAVQAALKERDIRCMVIWECAIREAQKSNSDPSVFFSLVDALIKSPSVFMEIDSNVLMQRR